MVITKNWNVHCSIGFVDFICRQWVNICDPRYNIDRLKFNCVLLSELIQRTDDTLWLLFHFSMLSIASKKTCSVFSSALYWYNVEMIVRIPFLRSDIDVARRVASFGDWRRPIQIAHNVINHHQCVLPKGRSSTANSGTKVAVLGRIGAIASRCFPHPTLSPASEQILEDLKWSQGHQRGDEESGFD